MVAVTNLAEDLKASTSFEQPFLLAKRFPTWDHLTNGRIGWNIVTSYKKAAFKAIGLDSPVEYDERLWESSWSSDALSPNPKTNCYVDPEKVRTINHKGKYYSLNTRHIVDPSPQRTPFLFQAVEIIRKQASELGHDPQSIKFFGTFTPIVGRTDKEALEEYKELRKYASVVGGLIKRSQQPTPLEAGKMTSLLDSLLKSSKNVPRWTPHIVAEEAAIGGLGPLAIGSPQTVADEMERWIREADLDGFNIGYVTTPGTFEDSIDLVIPELRRRGLYPEDLADSDEPLTAREKIYGRGQKELRDDHPGARYKYDVYQEDPPYVEDYKLAGLQVLVG
ncbi:hypothetical protein N7451_004920 [Penicillium sp. IBT 35674x]|nr:hypothetical protein N7451_004920 [Penicillium sp. IBT 35674x]